MATFPPEPPFDPDAPIDPPALNVPLPPPEVGEGSPWAPADSENRDRILDWWRAWFRRIFFPWIAAWIAYWADQWQRLADYLNEWISEVDEYISEHAISGYSWRTTQTDLAESGDTTGVVFTNVDQDHRPLVVGDLVSDQSDFERYGIITTVTTPTTATVHTLGQLHGLAGLGWWTTQTPISATGTTDVELPVEPGRVPQVDDLVVDASSALRYGQITVVIDDTHATVTPLGVLRGLAGFGWWTTATPIAHSGTTDVVIASGPDRDPQINDLVVDESSDSAYGEITAVTDPTHVTVAYIGTLQGPAGIADLGSFDFTTPSLAAGAAYQGQMADEPAMVGAFTVSGDKPAWIRVYASEAYMIADEDRPIMTPLNIADDHGCYLDFVGTALELSKTLTPGVQITDLGSGVWLSVTNTDPSDPQAISVHFDYRIFRE